MATWVDAIAAIAKLLEAVKSLLGLKRKEPEKPSPAIPAAEPAAPKSLPPGRERYQVVLGRRHREIREQLLVLSPREMADFYGFEKTQQLEDHEDGVEEFPRETMKRLCEFFFVSEKYLQTGQGPIFQSFALAYTRDNCRRFLHEGFSPVFLCTPKFEEDGHAILVFTKEEKGFRRCIRSFHRASFRSTGGGKDNVRNLIHPMLERGLKWTDADLFSVELEEWRALESGRWYSRHFPRGHYTNHDAADIFHQWFEQEEESRRRVAALTEAAP